MAGRRPKFTKVARAVRVEDDEGDSSTNELSFITITTGQYTDELGHVAYHIFGLTQDGRLWRYSNRSRGWEPFPMLLA